MSQIPALVHVNSFANNSIAKADREANVIYLSKSWIPHLSPGQLMFAVLHEYGHIYLNDKDDFLADRWAAKQYLKDQGNLKEPIKLFNKIFGADHPRTKKLKALISPDRSKDLDELAPLVLAGLIGTGGNIFQSIAGIFGQKQAGKDARAIAASNERAAMQQGTDTITIAGQQSRAAIELAKKKIESNKQLITGAILLAAVIGLVLVLRDIF